MSKVVVRAPGWDIGLSLVGASMFYFLWSRGLSIAVLLLAPFVYLPVAIIVRVVQAIRRRVSLAFLRRPFAREHRAEQIQCLVRWALLVVVAIVFRVSLIPEQLHGDHEEIIGILDVCLIIAGALELVPVGTVRVPTNVLLGAIAVFLGIQLLMLVPEPDASDGVVIDPPLDVEMLVYQGGGSPLVNHHFLVSSQRDAIDLVALDDGRIHRDDTEALSSFVCFGQVVRAPAAGTVVRAVDRLPDQAIGESDRSHPAGNHVVIELGARRYLLLAHLRQGSLRVREGDAVACGQPLAECGNSGNTSEPHLHIQVQDRPDFSADAETFPILFRNVLRARGDATTTTAVPVRRSDRLQPTTRCN